MTLTYGTVVTTATGFLGTPATTVTTPAFNVAAGGLIVVVAEAYESFTSTWAAPVFTDSLGTHLTWTLTKAQVDPANFAATWVAWARSPSAQTGMTASVTITLNDSGQYLPSAMASAFTFTGQDTTTPVLNVLSGTSSTGSAAVTMTPVYSGSFLFLAATRVMTGGSPTVDTAGTGNYAAVASAFGASYGVAWAGTSSGPAAATANVNQTLALSTTDTPAGWQYIAFEIAPPHAAPPAGTGWTIGGIAW